MEDKFAENLVLLMQLSERIATSCCQMQKVCSEILECYQVKVSTISPEDYD